MVEKIMSPKKERSSHRLGLRTPNVIPDGSARTVKKLLKVLRNKNASDDTRTSAASDLGYIGQESKDAVPVIVSHLISALTDESASLRAVAAKVLGSMGPNSKDAVSVLNSALKDEDASVREWAAFALGTIGPDSQDDIPTLIAAAAMDESASVRSKAHEALGRLRQIIVSHLVPLLTHKNPSMRSYVARALGLAGRRSKDAISALISRLVTDEDISVKYCAACAFGGIAQNAKKYHDEDALLKVKDAIPALKNTLRHNKNNDMKMSAAWALGNIEPEIKSVVRSLIKVLSDKDGNVRENAVEALRKAGKGAVSELMKASHSKSSIVRSCAKDALERIKRDGLLSSS